MAWEYPARMSHHSRTGYATAAVEDMPHARGVDYGVMEETLRWLDRAPAPVTPRLRRWTRILPAPGAAYSGPAPG